MTWTLQKPSTSGWYWYRDPGFNLDKPCPAWVYEVLHNRDGAQGKIVYAHLMAQHEPRPIGERGPLSTEFPNELEAIAYGKNLVLKHVTESGLEDAVEQVEWWIKGNETYYCPACLSPLAHEAKDKRGSIPQHILQLKCDQCQTVVNIPAAAFSFAPH